MSVEIPGDNELIHDQLSYKAAELTVDLVNAVDRLMGVKKDEFEAAAESLQTLKTALYASRITLIALNEMGLIHDGLDVKQFKKEVDKIKLRMGGRIEPSVTDQQNPVYVADLDKLNDLFDKKDNE